MTADPPTPRYAEGAAMTLPRLRCPVCRNTQVEPQMDSSTHILYWCGECWVHRRKPFVFEVAKKA